MTSLSSKLVDVNKRKNSQINNFICTLNFRNIFMSIRQNKKRNREAYHIKSSLVSITPSLPLIIRPDHWPCCTVFCDYGCSLYSSLPSLSLTVLLTGDYISILTTTRLKLCIALAITPPHPLFYERRFNDGKYTFMDIGSSIILLLITVLYQYQYLYNHYQDNLMPSNFLVL